MKTLCKSIVVRILSWQAAWLLRRTKPTIIAITGSVGKTSTKDAIYTILKQHTHARKSEKSFNSELGVPLTVLGLKNAWNNPFGWLKNIIDGFFMIAYPGNYPDVLVLEMGVDRPGDMARLTEWITPDVVVLTRLPDVPVHVEYFDSPAAVTAEKMQLVTALPLNGTLIYNHDDEQIRRVVPDLPQTAIGFSRYSLSQFTASADQVVYRDGVAVGLEFKLTHLNSTHALVVNGSLGVQHAYNYAAAVAVANQFSISIADAVHALAEHQPPPGRMRIIPGLKHTLIIDDTYNSSPTAAERALLSLKELKGGSRKIAVLGDMLELGQYSTAEHEKIGALAAECCHELMTVGVRARKIASGALAHGMSEKHIRQYDSIDRASSELQTMLKRDDIVLVKASQSIRGEKLVYEIMAEPQDAPTLLVRQDPAWQRR
jgi:UDP-N-acetylmuramyl pentapeptide synthase